MSNQINGGKVLIDRFLNKSQLQEVVTKTVGSSEFSIEDARIRPASDTPLGFCGDHMRLAIDVNVAGTVKTFNYFVKTTPKDNDQKLDLVEKYGLASNESRAFKLIEELKKFTGDEPFCAGCYYASDSLLVLDDLALEGFESNDARKPFLKEHCLTTLTSLANFHASSFIYEEQQTKINGRKFRFSEAFKDTFNRSIFDMTPFYKTGLHTTLKVAELFSKHAKDDKILRLMRDKWYSLWERNLELADPSPLCRNSLAHRDLWARNLLYKYEDGIPTQCRLADFQTVGCLPPAADLHSAIYLNTSAAQRKESYAEFIEHYYRKLTENLKRYNLDVEDFAPKEEFLKWCQKYRMWGSINGMAWHPAFVNSEDIIRVQEHSEEFESFFNTVSGRFAIIEKAIINDELFKKIVMEYIEEFIESYILN